MQQEIRVYTIKNDVSKLYSNTAQKIKENNENS